MGFSDTVLRRVVVLAFALVLVSAGSFAQNRGCAEDLQTWATRCSRDGLQVQLVACPSDELAVVSARVGEGSALRIELARGGRRAFRTANGLGLSPVGEFPDWNVAPAPLREAFERVLACAATPLPTRLRGGVIPAPPGNLRGPRVPWLLALAALIAAWRARRVTREAWRHPALVLLGSAAATLGLRALRHPPGYFHQNGQGPLWIDHLFTSNHLPYGPGFGELFALPATLTPATPERTVFGLQSLLASAQPACAWWIARAVGANPWVAGGLAVATALDPMLGRLARSEAYFAVGTSLGMLAAVALVRARDAWGPLIAGLLLAQAVRVHPGLWAPLALVPLVAALADRPARERARGTLVAFGVVGVVVALTSGASILTVLRSEVGTHWLGVQSRNTATSYSPILGLGVGLAAVTAISPLRWRGALPVMLLAVTFGVRALTDNYTASGSPLWIITAYARTFLPVELTAIAALAATLGVVFRPTPRAFPLLGTGLALALTFVTHRRRAELLRFPTDVLELQRAWAWRTQLPRGARVLSVSRAGHYILVLPIHGGAGRDLQVVTLDPLLPPPDLHAYGPNTYYYRASTCSTPSTRDWCTAFERSARLRPVETFSLPTIPSMGHLTYSSPRISVGLYQVTD